MDALALYTQGRYWEALSLAQQQARVQAVALSLLALGQVAEAQALLESWQPQESVAQAERLALLGFAAFRKGDPATYRRWALAAAHQAQTPLTLYHLGLSLPPQDGLLALQAALDRCEGPPEEQARLAYALARTHRRLGRLAEALSYASRAVLQAPEQPHYRLEELTLLALGGEEPLPALERSLPPLLAHAAPGVRYYALWLSLLLQGMQGQESPELLEALLRQNSSPHQPYDLPLLVLLFKHRPSARPLLSRWLRAAAAGSSPDPLPQALQSLAQGLWHYPSPEARPLLEAALSTLQTEWAEEALRAAAHLAALEGVPLPAPYRRMARALYPVPNPQALKSELCRLRQQGFEVQPRPYRLCTPIEADFLKLQEALQHHRLAEALSLYQGPLLPKSQAPGIELLRNHLEEQLKGAVLRQPDPEPLYRLAQKIPDDLVLWEALLERLPEPDPRRPAVRAWVRRLNAQYR